MPPVRSFAGLAVTRRTAAHSIPRTFTENDMTTTPRVEACIDAVMARYPRTGPVSQAKYYEEVHQHLGPLARDLERELAQMTTERDHWKANHDHQASRGRFLTERGDIPLERVQAYEEMEELRKGAERYQLLSASAERCDWDMSTYWRIHTVDIPMGMPRTASLDDCIDAKMTKGGGA